MWGRALASRFVLFVFLRFSSPFFSLVSRVAVVCHTNVQTKDSECVIVVSVACRWCGVERSRRGCCAMSFPFGGFFFCLVCCFYCSHASIRLGSQILTFFSMPHSVFSTQLGDVDNILRGGPDKRWLHLHRGQPSASKSQVRAGTK